MMRTTQRTADGVAIISLDGQMTRNDGFGAVKTTVADVSYMDSTGVGELVSAFITTRNHDGKLKLLNPSHRLRELFEVAKLVTVFEMFDDEAEALRSF